MGVGGCRGRAMDVGVMVCVGALNMRPSACARACVWVVLHLPGRRERDRCVCVGVCVCVGGVINDLRGLFFRRERGLTTVKAPCSSTAADALPFRTGLPRLAPHSHMQSQSRHDTARSIRHVDDGPGLRDFVNHAPHATVSVTDCPLKQQSVIKSDGPKNNNPSLKASLSD